MRNSGNGPELGVVIGRFQPFHNAHAALLRQALDLVDRVMVVLGSAFHARSPKNPFTWQERAEMISLCLSEADRTRVSFVPLRDYHADNIWASALRRAVGTATPHATRIALIGHFKDASSYYLNLLPQWQLHETGEIPSPGATAIRRILFDAESLEVSLAAVSNLVPLPIRQYMKAWVTLPFYGALVEEHRSVGSAKAAWKNSPYPPIFTTADSIVSAAGNVLLIKRGQHPGKGLWALPGGCGAT